MTNNEISTYLTSGTRAHLVGIGGVSMALWPKCSTAQG